MAAFPLSEWPDSEGMRHRRAISLENTKTGQSGKTRWFAINLIGDRNAVVRSDHLPPAVYVHPDIGCLGGGCALRSLRSDDEAVDNIVLVGVAACDQSCVVDGKGNGSQLVGCTRSGSVECRDVAVRRPFESVISRIRISVVADHGLACVDPERIRIRRSRYHEGSDAAVRVAEQAVSRQVETIVSVVSGDRSARVNGRDIPKIASVRRLERCEDAVGSSQEASLSGALTRIGRAHA